MDRKNIIHNLVANQAHSSRLFAILIIAALLLVACQSAAPSLAVIATEAPAQEEPVLTEAPGKTEQPTIESLAVTPAVTVIDQAIVNGAVTVSEIVSDGPGWLVIHAQADGKPGPILGYTQVADGISKDVVVKIDTSAASETLFAMLHIDAGEEGVWEFPDGPDAPVKVEEKVVTPPFKILAALMPEMSAELVLSLSNSDELGPFMVGPEGMTLYLFTKDGENVTNCYDKCAEAWPPLMLGDGQTIAAEDGLEGKFSTTERTDGGQQITYNGMPLYYWFKDEAPGDTTGHGVNGVWAVVGPQTIPYTIAASESQVSYEVGEVFLEDNRFAVAVGLTSGIEGKVYIDLSNPLATLIGPIEIDISQFTSDSDRRDNKIRSDFLESLAFPIATFVPAKIEGLTQTYNEGDELTLQVTGNLTVKETTQEVTFEVTAVVENGQLTGSATTTILMSDFGVGPISLGILKTEDEVKIAFDFIARP